MRHLKPAAAMLLAGLAFASGAFADTSATERRNLDLFINDLRELVAADKTEVMDRIRLAALLNQAGQSEEAKTLLREAAELEPELNALLNPGALPEIQALVRNSQADAVGPDVIVGDLPNLGNYTSGGAVNGFCAFSIATTSCNLGTQWLQWFQGSNQHPVIAQNIYRIKDGRFEQIGNSWLKHGFCALQLGICGACSPAGGGCEQWLGLGCSDPYSASLNGDQGNLGPRWQVNPSTGVFAYPFNATPIFDFTLDRRVQVAATDLNPALNSGAIYLAEGHYIAQDDATAGNKNNNASYRRFTPNWNAGSGTVQTTSVVGSTVREKAAIEGWKAFDPTVNLTYVDIPGDGRFIIGSKATDNGNGTWRYEYAVYNMNSDQAGMGFSVPTPGNMATGVGFKDVAYRAGDGWNSTFGAPVNFDGTDWTPAVTTGMVRWSTQSFAMNPNANALRWGTVYNFRFDASSPPTTVNATLDLFKGGASQTAAVLGPACLLAGDINGDNIVNFTDLNLVLSSFGTIYNFSHLNNVLANFGRAC